MTIVSGRNRKTLAIFAALMLGAGTLAGCGGTNETKYTDEQVLGFFGSQSSEAASDAPLTISNGLDKCIGFISGLDSDLYKNESKAQVDQLTTACAGAIQKLVDDKTKNKYGFTIETFKNTEFAQQIRRVREAADIAYKTYLEKQKTSAQ